MTAAALPSWAVWAQALGAPAATLALACLGAWIAYRQVRIAEHQERISREKLRHDLYDRRYAIYLAFHRLVYTSIGGKGMGSVEIALRTASVTKAQSRFILNAQLGDYLDRLHDAAFRIEASRSKLWQDAFDQMTSEQKQEALAKLQTDRQQVFGSSDSLGAMFKPFLRLQDR